MKKVLVTGSSGFIGRHLIIKLKQLGYYVIGLDLVNIDDQNLDLFYQLDIVDYLPNVDIDIIYHLAGSAEPNVCDKDPIATLNTYIAGTNKALLLAKTQSCKIVVPSTINVETYQGVPGDRNYSYIVSKLTTDALCFYYKQEGVDVNIVRLANVYGPNFTETDTRVIPTFIKKIKNKQEIQVSEDSRSFVYINTVIDLLINCEEDSKIESKPIKIKDLAMEMKQIILDKELNLSWVK